MRGAMSTRLSVRRQSEKRLLAEILRFTGVILEECLVTSLDEWDEPASHVYHQLVDPAEPGRILKKGHLEQLQHQWRSVVVHEALNEAVALQSQEP